MNVPQNIVTILFRTLTFTLKVKVTLAILVLQMNTTARINWPTWAGDPSGSIQKRDFCLSIAITLLDKDYHRKDLLFVDKVYINLCSKEPDLFKQAVQEDLTNVLNKKEDEVTITDVPVNKLACGDVFSLDQEHTPDTIYYIFNTSTTDFCSCFYYNQKTRKLVVEVLSLPEHKTVTRFRTKRKKPFDLYSKAD